MERYILKLEPLTVMHIGTGRTIEPHEYTITNQNDTSLYLRINFEDIFDKITDVGVKKKLIHVLASSNDFIKFRKILQDEPAANSFFDKNFIYGSHVTEEFKQEFKDKYSNPNNQLAVLEGYRPPNSKTNYIPGSSVKGALRTAVLQKYADKANTQKTIFLRNSAAKTTRYDVEFQRALLQYNDAKEDPFRTVHVSDGKILGNRQMLVGIAYNFSLKNGIPRDSTIPIYLETIRGMLAEGNAHTEVSLNLHRELKTINKVPFDVKIDEIITDCNAFYKRAWEFEYNKFYTENSNITQFDAWEVLNKEIHNIGKGNDTFLLRIGRFSHAEAVTLEGFRRIPKGYGKSRNLFSYQGSLLPMGWLKASVQEVKND